MPDDGQLSPVFASQPKHLAVALPKLVARIADELVAIDCSGQAFRHFSPGVGPFGEPQLIRLLADRIRKSPEYAEAATRRAPDLLIPSQWAIEFKIARPFGDNGKEAENWSVNLLHPYPGNVSVVGDCLKLLEHSGSERRAALVIGYEHTPAKIDLSPLFASFEAIARNVMSLRLSDRVEQRRLGLCHPVHQQLRVAAWEVLV